MNLFPVLVAIVLACFAGAMLVTGAWQRRLRLLGVWGLVFAFSVLALRSIVIVQPGTVSVQVVQGNVRPDPLVTSPVLVNPFSDFHVMNVRRVTVDLTGPFAVEAMAGPGQWRTAEISATYRLTPELAPAVFGVIGTSERYEPEIRLLVRSAAVRSLQRVVIGADGATLSLAGRVETEIQSRLTSDLMQLGLSPETAAAAFVVLSVDVVSVTEHQTPTASAASN